MSGDLPGNHPEHVPARRSTSEPLRAAPRRSGYVATRQRENGSSPVRARGMVTYGRTRADPEPVHSTAPRHETAPRRETAPRHKKELCRGNDGVGECLLGPVVLASSPHQIPDPLRVGRVRCFVATIPWELALPLVLRDERGAPTPTDRPIVPRRVHSGDPRAHSPPVSESPDGVRAPTGIRAPQAHMRRMSPIPAVPGTFFFSMTPATRRTTAPDRTGRGTDSTTGRRAPSRPTPAPGKDPS